MKILDFIKAYNFHDSLLENYNYNAERKELIFEIDFCYWAQESFKDGDEENGSIKVIFYEVSDFMHDEYKIDSDSILNLNATDSGNVELTVETDDGDVHCFSFKTSEADFLEI